MNDIPFHSFMAIIFDTVIVNCHDGEFNIRMRLKAVRKLRNSGVIALDYVHTAKNLADPFTKGLSRIVIDNASREMGMRPT